MKVAIWFNEFAFKQPEHEQQIAYINSDGELLFSRVHKAWVYPDGTDTRYGETPDSEARLAHVVDAGHELDRSTLWIDYDEYMDTVQA